MRRRNTKRSLLDRLKPFTLGAAAADMAMLLLVFFMATTSTEPPRGVEVELPKARTEGAEQDSIYITIGNDGKIYYDGRYLSIEELNDQLSMRRGESDRPVSLTADKNLSYATVGMVLELLKQNEFLNVVFMSEPRENAPGGTP
jgi:biopolymer transport protein ExbD